MGSGREGKARGGLENKIVVGFLFLFFLLLFFCLSVFCFCFSLLFFFFSFLFYFIIFGGIGEWEVGGRGKPEED